jgi:hypothetical protein
MKRADAEALRKAHQGAAEAQTGKGQLIKLPK